MHARPERDHAATGTARTRPPRPSSTAGCTPATSAKVDEEGFVYIVDRAKDMVIRGGENVYCAEVEAALFEHPAVDDAAVIGIPHDELGEEVGAVVRLEPGTSTTPEELQCVPGASASPRSRSRPTSGSATRELPRNPGGKILKTHLRREVLGS